MEPDAALIAQRGVELHAETAVTFDHARPTQDTEGDLSFVRPCAAKSRVQHIQGALITAKTVKDFITA